MRRLSTIALALGEERTRSELIPFLTDAQVSFFLRFWLVFFLKKKELDRSSSSPDLEKNLDLDLDLFFFLLQNLTKTKTGRRG